MGVDVTVHIMIGWFVDNEEIVRLHKDELFDECSEAWDDIQKKSGLPLNESAFNYLQSTDGYSDDGDYVIGYRPDDSYIPEGGTWRDRINLTVEEYGAQFNKENIEKAKTMYRIFTEKEPEEEPKVLLFEEWS